MSECVGIWLLALISTAHLVVNEGCARCVADGMNTIALILKVQWTKLRAELDRQIVLSVLKLCTEDKRGFWISIVTMNNGRILKMFLTGVWVRRYPISRKDCFSGTLRFSTSGDFNNITGRDEVYRSQFTNAKQNYWRFVHLQNNNECSPVECSSRTLSNVVDAVSGVRSQDGLVLTSESVGNKAIITRTFYFTPRQTIC